MIGMTTTDPETQDRDSGGPRAMGRVLALLELLARAPGGLPLADISVALGAPKSTLLNSLRPLVADDFLVVEGVLYRLGPKAFRLAATIGSAYDLPRMVRGYLRALADQTQETIGLAVLDHEMKRFVYIDVIESSRPVRYTMRLGDKSLRFEIGLFLEGREAPVAAGYFTHVYVDRATRRPVSLTDMQKASIADLVVG